jgi:PAS domain S-box-containing protein
MGIQQENWGSAVQQEAQCSGQAPLMKSSTSFERIINTLHIPIISTGLDWVIQSWNPAAEQLYGYSAASAIGNDLGTLLKTSFNNDSSEQMADHLYQQPEIESEAVHTTADGRELEVLCTLSFMTDDEGNACGYVAVMHSGITRYKTEIHPWLQAAADNAKRQDFIQLLTSPGEGIYIIDFNAKQQDSSMALLQRLSSVGITFEEALGLLQNHVVPDDVTRIRNRFSACVASGQTELRFGFRLKPDGLEICRKFSRCMISYDNDSMPIRIFGIYIDIAKNESLEIQLEQQTVELNQITFQLETDLSAMNHLHKICTCFVEERELPLLMEDIVSASMDIMHADMGTLQVLNTHTDTLQVIAQQGLTQEYIDYVDRVHSRPGIADQAKKMDKTIIVEDMYKHPMFSNRSVWDLLSSNKLRAMVGTPLLSGSGKLLGMLSAHFKQQHIPNEHELRIMELLARLTADIMERASAEEKLRNSTQGTELLYEVVEKLLVGSNTQEVIQECCTKVMKFLHCDIFLNYLCAADKTHMMLHSHCGLSKEDERLLHWVDCGKITCGLVAAEGSSRIVEDVQNHSDPRMAQLKMLGLRSYACYPLTVQNEVLGTLSFGSSTRNAFLPNELALIKAVSSHVAVALHRLQNEEALKRMTEEISDKNRLITDFFTNISHEFKTPLSIILVDLQLMEYRLKDKDEDTREKLGKMVLVMRQNALRLLRLIGNLLDVTKIDAGFMKARLVSLDVVGLVGDLVDSVRDYAENAQINISFISSLESRFMPVDSEKMERILLNLLSNAIKHTQEGGHIQVCLMHSESTITICVKDDGEGIPQDKQEYMFDRFRQANTSLTRSSEGCGIGLSLTKALVELLQGKIWFESWLGQGSEFYVEMPVLKTKEPSQSSIIEGMPRNRKVEMEFSDIHKVVKQY